MNEAPTDFIAEAITEAFGERCFDYVEGCAACDAWKQYDDLRALSASQEAAAPSEEPVAEFGEGKLVIDTGTFRGRPAVFIAPAKMPGEVGASAAREGHDLHSLQPGEIVWAFPTDAHARAVADALVASPAVAPVAPHSDDAAVDRFAEAMKAKLAKKRAEGRGGWDGPDCSAQILSDLLRAHVDKGDPLDVGNLAMMLHQRGERII